MKSSDVKVEVIRRLRTLSTAEKLHLALDAGMASNTIDYLIYMPDRRMRWSTIERLAVAMGGRFKWQGDTVEDVQSLIRSYLSSLQGVEIMEFAARHNMSTITAYQYRSGRIQSISADRVGPILDDLGITCDWE